MADGLLPIRERIKGRTGEIKKHQVIFPVLVITYLYWIIIDAITVIEIAASGIYQYCRIIISRTIVIIPPPVPFSFPGSILQVLLLRLLPVL